MNDFAAMARVDHGGEACPLFPHPLLRQLRPQPGWDIVYLSPAVSMCGNSNTWAYLDTTDTNYSTSVATVMMARAQGLMILAMR